MGRCWFADSCRASFRDTQLSDNIPGVAWIKRRFQRIFGISLPLVTNMLPLKCKCTTVVGKPILVEKDEHPSKEKVGHPLEQGR